MLVASSTTPASPPGTAAAARGADVEGRTLAAISPWDNPNQSPPLPAPVKKKKKPKAVSPPRSPARGGPPPNDATRGGGEESEAPAPAPTPHARPRRSSPADANGEEDPEEGAAERPQGRPQERARERAQDREQDREEERSEEGTAERPARSKGRAGRGRKSRVVEADGDSEDGSEEDEDDAEAAAGPIDAMPVILPRLVSLQIGPAVAGRSFHFNGPVNPPLQSESSFPRIGVALELQAYPLLLLRRGFYRLFGVNVIYERDGGQAAVPQPDGSTNSFPVVQNRLQLDVRYPFLLGDSVLVAPAIGYATTSFDLKRNTPVPPSMCPRGSPEACIPDVAVSHLLLDLNLRVALTRALGLSLVVGYLRGTGVRNNITSESRASATGFHGELGALFLVTSWLGVGGKVSYWNNGYTFADTTFGYTGATETYYGGTVGLSAFTE